MKRIVYLHGFASSPASGKAQFFRERLVSRGISLEIPDLARGDFEHLTVTGQLEMLTELAAGEPVALIGSSMGGYLAALYASRHSAVERLVLMAPAFAFSTRWNAVIGDENLTRWKREGTIEVYHYGEGRRRKLAYGLIEDALCFEEYPDFRQPALIFHGRRDDTVPVAYSEQFARTHANARLSVLDSDHQLLDVLPAIWNAAEPFLLDRGSDPT